MIDDKPVQMPIESMWLDNEVFIPVAYFVPLVNRYTNLKLEYNHSRQELRGAT
ncbi:MAG: hypothetical protein GWN16_08340, partial [Calditrichae bacterium]|nr:hypothetical protein [Calditrichia bacterium]